MKVPGPRRAAPGRPAGQGALHRDRRRRDLRDRPDHGRAQGVPVTGSDDQDTPFLPALRELGVTCHLGYDAEHLVDADTLVVTTAAREDNPEVLEARRRGLRILPRSAGLAAVMAGSRVLAVAGTHGKTTTTGLLTIRAPRGRRRSVVRRRRGAHRDRPQRRRRHRRPLRGRGRRERRRLPGLPAPRRRSSPTSRPTTSTTGAPRRPTTGLRGVRRHDRPLRLPGVRRRRPGAAGLAGRTPAPGASRSSRSARRVRRPGLGSSA